MSYNQIARLLKKKGWTGKEVGQLLISSMLNDIRQMDKEEKTPLFSQADFENIESSLSTERDYLTYGVYRDLYSSIIDSFNRGQGIYQQFYNGFSRLYNELAELINSEEAQKALDDIPLIMTESQYQRLQVEASKRLGEYKFSFCEILFNCLQNAIARLEIGEHIGDKSLEEALEATKQQPGQKSQFYSRYNELYGVGYYTLPDGTRSDQVEPKEWEKAVNAEYIKTHKLTVDGEPATPEETIKHYKKYALLKAYELFYTGAETTRAYIEKKTGEPCSLTDEEIEAELAAILRWGTPLYTWRKQNPEKRKLLEALDFIPKTAWTDSTEPPPEGLTLYDFMELYIDESLGAAEQKEALQTFKKDCPALYDALKAYIEKTVPALAGLKPNQLYKDIITAWELELAGVMGYEGFTEVTASTLLVTDTDEPKTIEAHRREVRRDRGIAIIQNPSQFDIDENGDYIERKSPIAVFNNLDRLDSNEERKAEIKSYARDLIYPAMSFLYAFNALMQIIGSVYDLPELGETARIDTAFFEAKMDGFNGLLYTLYYNVYGSKEDKKRKRAIIKEALYELKYEHLKPTREAIDDVTKELEALGISSNARKQLKYLDPFIDRLGANGKGAL